MYADTLHILLLEDEPADAQLLHTLLANQDALPCTVQCVERLSDALQVLQNNAPEIILADLGLPDADGPETFIELLQAAPHIPIVILSGYDDESLVLKAVQMGVQDYLPKEKLSDDLLIRSLRYAIERHQLKETLRESQRRELRLADLREVETMSHAAQRTTVTTTIYRSPPLSETVPEIFDALFKRYNELLDRTLEEQIKSQIEDQTDTYTSPVSDQLIALADQLGFVRASPRDVMELHVATLNHKMKLESQAKATHYLEEGRLLLIELMGYLISYYRNQSLGLTASPTGIM